jgi:hypothetical protein
VFRFLHSADLHLGKPFGGFEPELQAQLRRARLDMLPRLAQAARDRGAAHVVLAGDIFDVAEPAPRLVAQTLDALAAERDITWLCLPGNHDPHRPGGVWERLAASTPANLRLLLEAAPVAAAPGLMVLPAPCRARRSGFDPTAWMDGAPSAEGALRLGIAHGAVVDFAEDGQGDTIDIDRAARAGLDYLALGDWHGAMQLGPRTGYSGTPEPTGFRRNAQGTATLVTLHGPGAPPAIETVETATFHWIDTTVEMVPGTEVLPLIGRLTEGLLRRNTLVSLTLAGAARLPEIIALEEALTALGHGFAHWHHDRAALAIRHETGDLDDIAQHGTLRDVADRLLTEAEAGDTTAREALNLLYGWAVQEAAP